MKTFVQSIRLFFCITSFFFINNICQAQPDIGFQTDGNVNTLVVDQATNTLYLGGSFSYCGNYHGTCVRVDDNLGNRNVSWPVFDRPVYKIVSDGGSGWFVGGAFQNANNDYVYGIAHINSDGTLDKSWNAFVGGIVYSMCLIGDTLYFGGSFTTVGGQLRRNVASVNATTGAVTSWNPGANDEVWAMANTGSTLFIGGMFAQAAGQERKRLAAFDLGTGALTAWNPVIADVPPPATTFVRTLLVSGSTVYVGGAFNQVGSVTRTNIAAVNITTGIPTDWNVFTNGSVNDFELTGNTLYTAGSFSNVNFLTQIGLVALDINKDTDNTLPFTANVNSGEMVYDIYLTGSTLYAVGAFTTMCGQPRKNAAAVNITTQSATSWDPNPGNGFGAYTVFKPVTGNTIFIGGTFTSANGKKRNNIAAFDLVSRSLKGWDPNVNGAVHAILPHGTTVYIGGTFTRVVTTTRNRIAAINATTGAFTAWNPNINDTVFTLTKSLTGDTIYAGGRFTRVGGTARNRIAAINRLVNTGNLLTWNPNATGTVRILATSSNGYIVAGGDFTNIGGQNRNYLAMLNHSVNSNIATSWNPNANNTVRTVSIPKGNIVYAGGDFKTIGGQARSRVAAINSSGLATAWDPNPDSTVNQLVVADGIVYLAGDFNRVNGSLQENIAAIDIATNTNNLLGWKPISGIYFGTYCLAVSGNMAIVGGGFNATYFGVSAGGAFPLNYYISLMPSLGSPLPLQLRSFTAIRKDKDVEIKWQAMNVPQGTQFTVERSADGVSFTPVQVLYANSSEVAFKIEDNALSNGTYYYRLKIRNTSGSTDYSAVRIIEIRARSRFLPSVIIKNTSNIVNLPANSTLFIYNAAGQLCFYKTYNAGAHSLMLPGILNSNTYFYVLKNHNQGILEQGKLQLR